MKRILKMIGKILLIIIGIIMILLVILFVKNYIDSKKPWLKDDYYTEFQSDSELEMKYAGLGSYEVSKSTVKSNDTLKNIRIWYPSEMENGNLRFPLIVVTNASNMAALNYQPFFERLASWGFIVVGNDDRQAGTGFSTLQTLDYILDENTNSNSIFFEKIDEENIGIIGYSQGGAGAIRAVTEYNDENRYKVLFTGSAAYSHLAQMWGEYDASKVLIPWFMTAGTGTSDDSGVSDIAKEFGGVAPLSSLIDNYEQMTDDVFKIRARVTGAEHEEMQQKTDGYMTAWMLFHLQKNNDAGKVFVGENAEILNNSNWQDIEKNE